MPAPDEEPPGGQSVNRSTVGGDVTQIGSARDVFIGVPPPQPPPDVLDTGRGRWAEPIAVASLLVTIALALVGNLATGTVEVTGVWVPVTWVATGLLVAAAVVLLLLELRSGRRDPAVAVERALAALAKQVHRQWVDEAVLRRLRQPLPLKVRWSSTGRPVAADREVVTGEPGTTWDEQPFAGDINRIVQLFRSLRHRQLVVIGEPGAGKSVLALLLTLGLLEDPIEGEPVPVLLPISTWNPEREDVLTFAARRLTEDYPKAVRSSGGRQLAKYLVEQGRLLLVLDGLDELATSLQATAVRKLDDFTAAGRPLVVTCRSREYETAVQTGGHILSRAAVVEIKPVTVDQAIDFLSHPAPSRPRWQKVFTHLRANPDGTLARILSTP